LPIPLKERIGGERRRRPKDRVKTGGLLYG